MAKSAIPAAVANLISLIKADATITSQNVQVTYGPPAARPEDEFIAVMGVQESQIAAALGRLRRDETFTIILAISVVRGGLDYQDAVERAYQLAGVVEDLLVADAQKGTLNNVVRVAEVAALPLEMNTKQDGSAVEARIPAQVRCVARI